MQSVGPYRFTEALGVCQVGTAWWAVDGQDRLVTLALLEGAAATDQPWREAFANAANAMAQAPGGQRYVKADLAAAQPWVAYPAQEGMGAQRLFQSLGMELHSAESRSDVLIPATGTVATPPRPVSGAPVSGAPAPVSGPPQLPWAMHATVPQQPQPEPQAVPTSPAPPGPAPAHPAPADPFAVSPPRIQPSTAAAARRGAVTWLAVAALLLAMVAAVGGVGVGISGGEDRTAPALVENFPAESPAEPGLRPWAQFPPSSPQERALAVAGPSLVFIEAIFTGLLRDRDTNAPLSATPLFVNRRCTGFVVNADGHALTSSSCVQPGEETVRRSALDALARTMVREGKLAAGQMASYITTNLEKTVFTGTGPGTAASARIYAQLNEAKGNTKAEPAVPVQVVKGQAVDSGNLALVKLAKGSLPTVELVPTAAATESGTLLVVAFATSDTDLRAATYRPQAKVVKVAGTSRRGALTMQRMGDDLGATSQGGVAIDPSGRVVGMIDQDLASPDRANRLVLPASAFDGLLTEGGVRPALGEPDRLYRTALDAYFTGRFGAAADDLARVVQQAPDNRLADGYRQNAAIRQQLEGDPAGVPAWARWLLAGAGTALLVVLVLLVAALLRRRA
ncbi:trypsin-like peptidase domain-containing protein [Micromonospora sp. NPDC047738]|uniref:trypsin-like peptidase domain-containing protein n=1 Tax=Micromonospora sp. NPDC047738 TaxID=3155741 RepID=UPI0033E36B72